jgi:hypothetical protein
MIAFLLFLIFLVLLLGSRGFIKLACPVLALSVCIGSIGLIASHYQSDRFTAQAAPEDFSELRAALLNERKRILSGHPDAENSILTLGSDKWMPYIDACEKQLKDQGKSDREATRDCFDDDVEMIEQLRFAARFPAAPAEYLDAVKTLSEFAACERRLFFENLTKLPVAMNPTAAPEYQVPASAINVSDDVVAQTCNQTTSGGYMNACIRLHREKKRSQRRLLDKQR